MSKVTLSIMGMNVERLKKEALKVEQRLMNNSV
jgi:hypothetical protein